MTAPRRSAIARLLEARRTRRAHAQAHSPSARGRFGLWGPMPYYSRRTRGGGEVSVGGCGCCLPLPLIGVLSTAGALRAIWRRTR